MSYPHLPTPSQEDAESAIVRHEVNEMVKFANNLVSDARKDMEPDAMIEMKNGFLTLNDGFALFTRMRKPRIRRHPFCRDLWICQRKGDISGIGNSPRSAYESWRQWKTLRGPRHD